MNVASLELCKELYAVSGWEADELWSWSSAGILGEQWGGLDNSCPAYDLGYLRTKLVASYAGRNGLLVEKIKDALFRGENVTAKLCIRLFRERILTQEATNNAKAD